MPTVTLTDPVTGTTVSSGLFATNHANLRALLNGGIDGVNLKGGPSLVTGEFAVWDGTNFVRSSTVRANNGGQLLPIITTSTLAGGPPGSPNTGDIWVATGVDGAGVRWMFSYNAASGSAFKWEFVGGPYYAVSNGSAQAVTTLNTWIDLNASVTAARAGDYQTYVTGRAIASSTSEILFGNGSFTWSRMQAVAGQYGFGYATYAQTVTAGQVLKPQGYITAATVTFETSQIGIMPVRIS